MSAFLRQVRQYQSVQRCFSICQTRYSGKYPDSWELATGVERWQAIQYAKGNIDPFLTLPMKRGPGTKDCPNVVPSYLNKRVIGCICHPKSSVILYWWLHEGFPRRCDCNYWFVLKRLPPIKVYEDC